MTTHNPENPENPGDKGADEPASSSTTGSTSTSSGDERFAAYDKSFERFVEGSVGTKAHAKRVGAAAGVKGDRLEVRSVGKQSS